MTDFRSKAEIFVTDFLDYIGQHDILDHFDKKTQKMVRSAGVEALIRQAGEVFPPRVAIGKDETDKLSAEEVNHSIENSENVLDRRDQFSRKIQVNGGAKGLLERILEGDVTAIPLARELLEADNGSKEFYVSPKK